MDVDRFARLLEIHGADLARWPADQREPASRLLEVSAEARAALAAARRLEALLARDRPAVEPARRDAIATAALRRIRALPAREEVGWRWLFSPALGAAFATMVVFGCFVGFQTAPPSSSSTALDIVFGGADRGVAGFIQ